VRRYAWTSLLGSLPMTAAATYLGHALDDLSASDPRRCWPVAYAANDSEHRKLGRDVRG
jgi:uncharacterized membrane protein YdjX (TVP38/TMEM64 family)